MKRNLIRPNCALAFVAASLIVPMTTLQSIQAVNRPVILKQTEQQEETNTTYTITLNPEKSGSLAGRIFNVYSIFDVTTGTGGAFNYTFTDNAATKQAVQRAVYKSKHPTAEDESTIAQEAETITIAQALDHIGGLQEGEQAGSMTSRSGSMREFSELLRGELVAAGVEPGPVYTGQGTETEQITGLKKGYYLIDEVTATAPENTGKSLCMVLTVDGDETIDVKGVYPTVEKDIQENDTTVGWNDIGDFEIGQEIPYRYQTTIPNISGYDTYQLIFHDDMDPALAFQSGTVSIKVTGTNDAKQTKEYKLTAADYSVIAEGESLAAEDSFQIQITDIKGIIDREIYKTAPDSVQDHLYGQTVEITYKAKLTEAAATDPGRPGFENQVRLEYSNNPDSNGKGDTGTTPWDTVVAFTFKVDATKYAEPETADSQLTKKLANAKFRLFRDEKCTSEIMLKKNGNLNEYIVQADLTEGGTDLVTDSEGSIKIIGLDQGTYYLKETEAPDGYHAPLTPLTLTITATYPDNRKEYSYAAGQGNTDTVLKNLAATVSYTESYNGQSHAATYETNSPDDVDLGDGSVKFPVINRTGKELPLTGSNTAWISLATGSVLVLGGIGLQKKKKN